VATKTTTYTADDIAQLKGLEDLYGLMAGLGYRVMNIALRKEQSGDEFVTWCDTVKQRPDADDKVAYCELGHLLFIPEEAWSGVWERITAER
jgi:hypothetical protein